MNRQLISLMAVTAVLLGSAQAFAHCEVPCGIYADQRRFEELLEDQDTIAKAITNIVDLAGATDALSSNQLVRWVNTKESHATNSQHIIAQYFMTQRIKPGSEGYDKKLAAAHAVMVNAMVCKQTADPKSAEALRASILDLYRAYTGNEPQLD